MRVATREGVLVIYDAAAPPEDDDGCSGYIGYWLSARDKTQYIFPVVLQAEGDLATVLLALERDLGVDLEDLSDSDDRIDEALKASAEAPNEEIVWEPATLHRAVEIMGFAPSALDDLQDGNSTVACACQPCAASPSPPSDCGSTGGLAQEALNVAADCCGCEDPCASDPCACLNCSDGNFCNYDLCDDGWCYHPPRSGSCNDDGNPCTNDVCSGGVCTHPARSGSCPDEGNPCTSDVCSNKVCIHPLISGPACGAELDGVCCVGVCCPDDANPCTDEVCVQGACMHLPNDDSCKPDNDPCTDDVCVQGACSHPPNSGATCTDDGDMCTDDVCVVGVCTHPQKQCEAFTTCGVAFCHSCVGCIERDCCADGNPCTVEVCSGSGNCCDSVGACRWSCGYTVTPPSSSCPEGCGAFLDLANVPDVVPLNDDDDNGNGIADYLEAGTVTGEDDRYYVTVSFDASCAPLPECNYAASTYTIQAASESGALRFFATSSGSAPANFVPWPGPATGWVEGRAVTSACGVRAGAFEDCGAHVHHCYTEGSPHIVVAKVAKLEWQLNALSYNVNSCTLADNEGFTLCPNNGGVRIFPDKLSSTDPTPADRRKVDLVATIEPRVAGVMVHFRVYDVDDPFDQLHGSQGIYNDVANVSLIDNDQTGGDNRGSVGMSSASDLTDGNGQVRITISVSMQPGDNYRAAATLLGGSSILLSQPVLDKADALSVMTNAQGKYVQNGDFSGYECPVVRSKMLTVWRKLTIEVDSMDRESETWAGRFPTYFEQDRCVVSSVAANTPATGLTTIQCGPDPEPNRAGFAGQNFFEGGAFWCVDGGQQWLIVRSAAGPESYTLTLWGNPGTGIVGQECKLRDDDPYFGSAPTGQLPRTTILDDNIRSAYRSAYIEIVEADPSLNLVNLVPWQSHLWWLDLAAQNDSLSGVSSKWDVGSQDAFWARHFVMCYQPDRNDASDGDGFENCDVSVNCTTPPYSVGGLSALPNFPSISGLTIRNEVLFDTGLSTIYVETIRDDSVTVNRPLSWQIAAHEIGHITLDQGNDYLCEACEHVEGGLMTAGDSLQNISSHRVFTAKTLARFRDVKRW